MKEDKRTILAVTVEPGKPAKIARIGAELEDMQAIVGGYIEAVPLCSDGAVLVCNEEGKFDDLPVSRVLIGRGHRMHDVICGTFFIAGTAGEAFTDLTDEQAMRYAEMFRNRYVYIDR